MLQNLPMTNICVSCSDKISEDDRSMMCDFCHRYTHITCDSNLPEEICDSLDKHDGNSMIYLCGECKPMLIPKSSEHLLDGITKKVEKILDDPNRKNLSDTILNRVSTLIRDLDQMVLDHKASMLQTQNDLKKVLSDTISETNLSNQRVNLNIQDLDKLLIEQRESIVKTEYEITKAMESMKEYHNTTKPKPNPVDYSDAEFPQPGQSKNPYGHPNMSQWSKPPDMTRLPRLMSTSIGYRGPPMAPVSKNQGSKWAFQPDESLVVYNLSNNYSVASIVDDF